MQDFLEKLGRLERLLNESEPNDAIKADLGLDRYELSHLRRLARTLTVTTRGVIERAGLTFAHARAIARLKGYQQEEFARDVAQRHWSVRRTEQEAKARVTGAKPGPDAEYYVRLSETIAEQIGHPVSIQVDAKDSRQGVIAITFADLDCFDSIMDRMKVRLN